MTRLRALLVAGDRHHGLRTVQQLDRVLSHDHGMALGAELRDGSDRHGLATPAEYEAPQNTFHAPRYREMRRARKRMDPELMVG